MIIDCPQCREQCNPIADAIPPEGLNVTCPACGMSFLLRPHATDDSPGELDTEMPPSPSLAQQPQGNGTPLHQVTTENSTTMPSDIFLQKDEIPIQIAQAYEQKQPPPPTYTEPENDFLSQHLMEEEPMPEEDLQVLMDDTQVEIGELADSEFLLDSTSAPKSPQRKKKSRSSIRMTRRAGIIIVLILVLAVLMFFGKDILQGSAKVLGSLGSTITSLLPLSKADRGKIQFSDLDSYPVTRKKKGAAVFVIQGKVTNRHDKQCHSIRVKGILFDERGKLAAEEVAYCGNILNKDQIRTDSPEKIAEVLQNAYGAELSNFNIQPGGSVPFMLVFFKPPEKLSEFSIEIVDYAVHEHDTN